MAEVIHENNRFVIPVQDKESILEYEYYGDSTVVFYHTYVPEEFRGKGYAREIINAAVQWAVQNNLRIIPTCSAVRRFLERHPELQENGV
jgi:predicted GNAT family acetyltransferase